LSSLRRLAPDHPNQRESFIQRIRGTTGCRRQRIRGRVAEVEVADSTDRTGERIQAGRAIRPVAEVFRAPRKNYMTGRTGERLVVGIHPESE
jgi:hypothetical protein